MSDLMSADVAPSPVLALRAAVHAALAGDAALTGLLGGPRIHDAAPRAISGLYVVFGEATARDRSAGDLRRETQEFSLTVWSTPGGPRPALQAGARIRALLDDADLSLAGHRLVLLRVVREDVRRDGRSGLSRVRLTFSAMTERLAG